MDSLTGFLKRIAQHIGQQHEIAATLTFFFLYGTFLTLMLFAEFLFRTMSFGGLPQVALVMNS